MNRKRRKHISLAALCLLAVVAVPVWLTWRAVRQQQRNQALIEAVQDRNVAKVRSLLEEGADANARDAGSRAINIKDVIRDLILQPHPKDAQIVQARRATALMLALGAGKANVEIAAALLRKGADPNIIVSPEFDWRLLHLAVLSSSPELIQALLQAGAKADAKDKTGDTALMLIAPKPKRPTNNQTVVIGFSQMTFVTGTRVTKPFSNVPSTHWSYEAVTENGGRTRPQELPQTQAQQKAIIRILQRATAQH